MKENQNQDPSGKAKLYRTLAVICGVLFAFCAVWLIRYAYQQISASRQLEEMKEAYIETPSPTPEAEEPVETEAPQATAETEPEATEEPAYPGLEGFEVPEMSIDFQALQQEQNADIYAWINIPGTVIDYPVVQHPTQPDYYLDYNLDGTKGYPGGIYTQGYNSKDWEDANTVIYGHNMKNGTMFAGLHQYQDSLFFEENPYIYLYLEDGRIRVYQIFAAYEYKDVNLVTYYQILGEAAYESYLEEIYTIDGLTNNFNEDITVTGEDKIITLSTCISSKPTMRYLVQAVLVAEG